MVKPALKGQFCPACRKQWQQDYIIIHGLPFFICPDCGNVFVPAGDLKRMKERIKEQQSKLVKPGLKIVH